MWWFDSHASAEKCRVSVVLCTLYFQCCSMYTVFSVLGWAFCIAECETDIQSRNAPGPAQVHQQWDGLADCFLLNLVNAAGSVQGNAPLCFLEDFGCWCGGWQTVYSKEKSLSLNPKLMLREGMAELVWLCLVGHWVHGLAADVSFSDFHGFASILAFLLVGR